MPITKRSGYDVTRKERNISYSFRGRDAKSHFFSFSTLQNNTEQNKQPDLEFLRCCFRDWSEVLLPDTAWCLGVRGFFSSSLLYLCAFLEQRLGSNPLSKVISHASLLLCCRVRNALSQWRRLYSNTCLDWVAMTAVEHYDQLEHALWRVMVSLCTHSEETVAMETHDCLFYCFTTWWEFLIHGLYALEEDILVDPLTYPCLGNLAAGGGYSLIWYLLIETWCKNGRNTGVYSWVGYKYTTLN